MAHFWSTVITPNNGTRVVPEEILKLSNIALAHEISDLLGRTTVRLAYNLLEEDGNESYEFTVLGTLIVGKIEQSVIDVFLDPGQEYILEVIGSNNVHVTGYYNSFSDKSSDDGTHSTRDVSESLDEEPKTSLKHARDTDLEITDNDPAKLKNIFKRLKDKDGKAKAVAIVNLPSSNGTGGGAIVDKVAPRGRQNNSVNGAEADVGVKFRDTKVGLGPMVVLGSTVVLRFIGKVAASGKLYDRNVDGKPLSFVVGRGEVPGFDQGIIGMQAGGERLIQVPAQLGFSDKPHEVVPPNSDLLIECKLLAIQ